MLSFRKKILLSDLILLLLFIALLFPFVERTVGNIMRRSLEHRSEQLIVELTRAPDLQSMIGLIQEGKQYLFQRVTLIDVKGNLLYDSHSPKVVEPDYSEEYISIHPEIEQAFRSGSGYSESYSEEFEEIFAYVALSFSATNGQIYVLRTGFPFNEILELTINLEVGFLILGVFILMLYSIMTWAIIHRITRPIQQIIDAILPYQEGREEFLPRIVLSQAVQGNEFNKLAFTLNSLSERIQKQIERLINQKKETDGILESLGEGVIALDASGIVTFANRVACRMLGVPHHLILCKSLLHIKSRYPELSRKGHELVLQVLQTSEPTVQTWMQKDGVRMYLDLISTPLAQQHGAILVLQDKTSEYKVLQMGKDFIANASHELRTPITIIRGFAETLADLPEISKEMLDGIVEKIVRTCGRLDKLVKSLLTLADIENFTEEKFRPSDLIQLAENCKHLLLTASPGVEISLHTELNRAAILVDADLLDLAIMNLLENAVKYSSTPAHIEMNIHRVDHHIHLDIKDRGIGIPEADLPHIFDRFYTVDKARSRKSGGAGLGLSIVKTIIEKHGGRLFAASQLGKGSTFTLSLPYKNPKA